MSKLNVGDEEFLKKIECYFSDNKKLKKENLIYLKNLTILKILEIIRNKI
jgi:hypothetical protein